MTPQRAANGELTFPGRSGAARLRALSQSFERVEEQVAAAVLAHDVSAAAAELVIRTTLVAFARRVSSAPLNDSEAKQWITQTVRGLQSTKDSMPASPRRKEGDGDNRLRRVRALSRRNEALIAGYALILNSTSARDGDTWFGNWIRGTRTEAALTVEELAPVAALEPPAWRRLERFPLEAASLTADTLVALLELFRLPFPLAAYQVRKGVAIGLPRSARRTGRYEHLHAQLESLLSSAREQIVQSRDTDLL